MSWTDMKDRLRYRWDLWRVASRDARSIRRERRKETRRLADWGRDTRVDVAMPVRRLALLSLGFMTGLVFVIVTDWNVRYVTVRNDFDAMDCEIVSMSEGLNEEGMAESRMWCEVPERGKWEVGDRGR